MVVQRHPESSRVITFFPCSAQRFPTVARAVGAGFAYHVGAGLGSSTPTIVGMMQDRGFALSTAMAACIAGSGALVILLLWLGPETRGTHFHAEK